MNLFSDWPEVCRRNVPLAPMTWFKLGGCAEYFAEPRSADQLAEIVRRCHEYGVAIRFLGLGANILVPDEGVSGVVVRLGDPAFTGSQVEGTTLTVGAGADMTKIVKTMVRQGLAGMEQLAGIPGTIGGGVCMNCGGKYGDLAQSLKSVRVIEPDGSLVVRRRDQLNLAYRQCDLGDACVVDAMFELQKSDPKELDGRFREIWDYKQSTQPPLGANSVGCIFRNPEGQSAGRLIDLAGLKGQSIGSAFVSDVHANFIMSRSGGRSSDVLQLIRIVQSRVLEDAGVALETEVRIWSNDSPKPACNEARAPSAVSRTRVA
jgi:UDP-N-acetylmuramate dehydrogenase